VELFKAEKKITWGTDDDALKRSDLFALHDIPLYQRIGGELAVNRQFRLLPNPFPEVIAGRQTQPVHGRSQSEGTHGQTEIFS